MRRLLLLPLLALTACATAQPQVGDSQPVPPVAEADGPKNVILFIADGFGPASATLGAAVKGAPLAFDSLLVGAVETSATDTRVTDSAAAATAYACGLKTFNDAIAVTPDRVPCVTVLERAAAAGWATGLVTTARITHATPASFAAHVLDRGEEDEIARQLAAADVDLLVGGGRRHFTRTGSSALADLRARVGTVATDRAGFESLDTLPAAALLADSHLAYEIDRDPATEPSLAEMARTALRLLDADDGPFFLMLEAGRIDHAGHDLDAPAHAREVLAYDEAVAAVLDFARRDGETLVVFTSDHETGGMSLGRDGVYAWDPAPLANATASTEAMLAAIRAGADPAATVRQGLGLDALPAGAAEALADALATGQTSPFLGAVSAIASPPARIAWTTTEHTAVDVGLYVFGPGAERFRGRMPNDAVGRALFAAMGFSVGR